MARRMAVARASPQSFGGIAGPGLVRGSDLEALRCPGHKAALSQAQPFPTAQPNPPALDILALGAAARLCYRAQAVLADHRG